MAWSGPGYNFYWGPNVIDGNRLYSGTTTTITQTDLATGTILNTSWATGFTSISGLAIYNNKIYVVNDGSTNIYEVDISNPSSPTLFFSNVSIANPVGLAIFGGYLYITNGGSNYISKISLTNPSGDFNIFWAQDTNIVQPVGICIYNNLVYVTTTGNSVIVTIDLITPSTVNIIKTYSGVSPTSLVAYGTNLYVGITDGSIQQLDLNGNVLNSSWAILGTNIFVDGLTINGTYLYCSDDISPNGSIYRYSLLGPAITCFKEGSKILTNKGYIPIENLRKGDLVKTVKHDYKEIDMIGKRDIYHPASNERIKDQLYKCSKVNFPELTEDLIITGCHSILVDKFKDDTQKEKTIQVNGNTYVTDNKYRLPACADDRTDIYEIKGNYTIYHLALENKDYYMNYGIYANGLLVETCSRRYLKELSNMTLIE